MNGYLLGTSVALGIAYRPEALSGEVRTALEGGTTFLSVISYWEVIKVSERELVSR